PPVLPGTRPDLLAVAVEVRDRHGRALRQRERPPAPDQDRQAEPRDPEQPDGRDAESHARRPGRVTVGARLAARGVAAPGSAPGSARRRASWVRRSRAAARDAWGPARRARARGPGGWPCPGASRPRATTC